MSKDKLSDKELNKVAGGFDDYITVRCSVTGGLMDQETFSMYYHSQDNSCPYYDTTLPYTASYQVCKLCKKLTRR